MSIKVGELRTCAKHFNQEIEIPFTLVDKEGEAIEKTIKIKPYLPFKEKIELMQIAYIPCITENKNINEYMFEVPYTVYFIKLYTDVRLPSDINEAYDLIKQLSLDKAVLEVLPDYEKEELQSVRTKFIKTKEKELSDSMTVPVVLEAFFNGLLDKLPNQEIVEEYVNILSKNTSDKTNKLTKELTKDM